MTEEIAGEPAKITVRVLGPFEVSHGGTVLATGTWPRRSRSLLTLLATAPARRRLRDELIDPLWPDSLPEQGASNLRKAVQYLRQGLGDLDPSPILAERGWVSLNPVYGWEIDLERFERALQQHGDEPRILEEELALYRGEPLEEERYEDWAAPIRDRIEREWRDGCLYLVSLYQARGRQEEAVRWLERLFLHDPLDEGVVQQVLSMLAEMGRRTEGLRLYQRFERRLREDLDLEPAAETVALVERLKTRTGADATSRAAVTTGPAEGGTSSEVRTFLVVDLRGYTRFTEEHGDRAAARLIEAFAGTVREVMGLHGGAVLELRGDEALSVFGSARQALQAAVELQERCHTQVEADPSLPLLVGIGLDTGEAVSAEGGYRGRALNLAARLCSLAGPGEVLASPTVTNVAGSMEGIAYVERGEARLKGFADPVPVFQIAPADAVPTDVKKFTGGMELTTDLPAESSPFIGREREVAAVTEALQTPGVRLVTLLGPGGVGKSRLALQVARGLVESFDGVFFVPLASVRDPDLVPAAIAETLGVTEQGAQSAAAAVKDLLRRKHLLLVLDNFEQVIEARSFVSDLVAACPRLAVLVTSRGVLHLAAEHEYPVPPLSLPDPRHSPSLESLAQYDAVALFIHRARAVKPDFTLTPDNAPSVAGICQRLDGLPLGIELAAARIRLFPPPALLGRLSSRLKLLTGGAHDLPARQQTLRGAIDWSYDLLDPGEQALFARLSVFAGGCTLEAVEAVCNADGDLEIDVLDGLASLVEKSLLRQEGDAEPRFQMLETIREYAAEKLQSRAESEIIRRRHGAYSVTLAEEADANLRGAGARDWLQRLEVEHENLRVVLAHAFEQGDLELGGRLALALWWFWYVRGYPSEGRQWLDALLSADAALSPAMRVRALIGAANLAYLQGEYERARDLADRSLTASREAGDEPSIAQSLAMLGTIAEAQGSYKDAAALMEESLARRRTLGDRRGIAQSLGTLGNIAVAQGEYERARALHEESLRLRRALGDERGVAQSLGILSTLALAQGENERAANLIEGSLALRQRLGDKAGIAYALGDLGTVALARGDIDRAEDLHEESLALRRELGDKWGIAQSLSALGTIALARGDVETAGRLQQESLTLYQELGDRRGIASSLLRLGMAAGAQAAPQSAARLWGAADALREAIGVPVPPIDRRQYEQRLDTARAELADEEWHRAWDEGRVMALDEAIAYARQEVAGTPLKDAPSRSGSPERSPP